MKLNEPLLIINLKTFEEGTGKKALEIAKIALKASKTTKNSIIIAGQAVDLRELTKTKAVVISQNIEAINYGSNTGHLLPEAV